MAHFSRSPDPVWLEGSEDGARGRDLRIQHDGALTRLGAFQRICKNTEDPKAVLNIAQTQGPGHMVPGRIPDLTGNPASAMGVTRLFGGEAHFYLAELGFKGAATFLLLEFLKGFLLTGGINEESGWRGFALPRLQARYPVIVSAGIVWFFWALWHLPYDIGRGDSIAWILENRLFWNLLFAILMAWLYNRTNGSILAPALFHPAMNAFGNQFSITTAGRILFIGLALFAIVSDRMWEKLPEESPEVHKAGSEPVVVAAAEYSAAG